MFHQDGSCAASTETIVVTSTANLPSTSVPNGIRLVVIRGNITGTLNWTIPTGVQFSIVGQSAGTAAATLTGPGAAATTETATIKVAQGDLYVRDLVVTAGSPGIWATAGSILRLDHVSVSSNTAGGILLDGAGFDIKNTKINDNGPNNFDSTFGGIRIQSLPSPVAIPKTMAFTTVAANEQIGISCASGTASLLSPAPTTVLSSSNLGGDIGSSCGFTSCPSASATCGAQP